MNEYVLGQKVKYSKVSSVAVNLLTYKGTVFSTRMLKWGIPDATLGKGPAEW